MVYAAAVAAALFYAANVPLCFAFFVRAEGGMRVGIGLRPFLRGAALSRARAGELPRPSPRRGAPRLPAKFWLFAALELLRRIEAVRVRARLGTGDAASTALLCGALQGIFSCLGRVTNFFKKQSVAEVWVEASPVRRGDELFFQGPTTGVVELTADPYVGNAPAQEAVQGVFCSLKTPSLVRRGDQLYRMVPADASNSQPD